MPALFLAALPAASNAPGDNKTMLVFNNACCGFELLDHSQANKCKGTTEWSINSYIGCRLGFWLLALLLLAMQDNAQANKLWVVDLMANFGLGCLLLCLLPLMLLAGDRRCCMLSTCSRVTPSLLACCLMVFGTKQWAELNAELALGRHQAESVVVNVSKYTCRT